MQTYTQLVADIRRIAFEDNPCGWATEKVGITEQVKNIMEQSQVPHFFLDYEFFDVDMVSLFVQHPIDECFHRVVKDDSRYLTRCASLTPGTLKSYGKHGTKLPYTVQHGNKTYVGDNYHPDSVMKFCPQNDEENLA